MVVSIKFSLYRSLCGRRHCAGVVHATSERRPFSSHDAAAPQCSCNRFVRYTSQRIVDFEGALTRLLYRNSELFARICRVQNIFTTRRMLASQALY